MNYSLNSNESTIIFYEFKIILLGDSGVGKTSLLSRYMEEGYLDNRPCTINVDFRIKSLKIDQNTSAKVTIWDTCGQERFKSMTYRYFKDAQGIILLFDVGDKRSFNNLNKWLEEIENNIEQEDISIILVGNKIDLEFRNVSTEEGKNFAKFYNLLYCETSSKEGRNVEMAFEMVTKDIISKKTYDNNKIVSPTSSLKAVKGKVKKKNNEINCC